MQKFLNYSPRKRTLNNDLDTVGVVFESLLNVYELVRKSDVCLTFVS